MFLQGYRTYIVAVLMAVFGALAVADWNAILSNPESGWVALFSAVVMAAMRAITTTPPGSQP